MAIAVEASSAFSGINVSAVDGLEVTRPSGFTAASLGLIIAGTDNGILSDPAFTLAAATGWTEVARTKDATNDRQSMIWRQFNPPDAATDVVPAVSDDVGAFYLRVDGVDTTTPVDAVGSQEYGTTSGGANFTVTNTVTTVTDGALAVVVVVFDGADGGNPITFGSDGVGANGWGSLTNVLSGGGGAGVTVAYATKLVATAGDAGQVEFNPPANDGWSAIMFALRPAAGGGEAELASATSAGATLTGSGTAIPELASATSAGATLTATAAATVELAASSTAGATLSATGEAATATAELAADSTSSATLAGSGATTAQLTAASTAGATLAGSAAAIVELSADSSAAATLTGSGEVAGIAELGTDSSAGATLVGSAAAIVELSADSATSATLTGAGSVVVELASISGASATLTATAGQVAPLAADSTSGATLTGSAAATVQLAGSSTAGATLAGSAVAVAELAAASTAGATLVAVGTGTLGPANLAASSNASATLTATAVGAADLHPITITIRDSGHTATIRDTGHTATVRDR